MYTITLLNEKGGVGKTSLANALASGLAVRGHRVLVADTDAQGHATLSFGVPKEAGLYNFLVRRDETAKCLKKVPKDVWLPEDKESQGEIFIIPSNFETRNIASSMGDGFYLANRIRSMADVFDFVIFDTSPTPSLLHTSIYMATDGIIYPTELEALSVDGLMESEARLSNANDYFVKRGIRSPIEPLGIVPNKTTMRLIEHGEYWKALVNEFGQDIMFKPISDRVKWKEAQTARKSIFAYAPDSDEAYIAERFVSEVMERMSA